MLSLMDPDIVDEAGNKVMLRGVGLGGWLNMENFITGYPGNEEAWRNALRQELGEDRYRYFFERFLGVFFGDKDAAFLQSLGLNQVRIAFNYRHVESDMEPFVIKEEGFRHLDRAIEACARHEIYTVIDLHAVQGYQNGDWHSDNPTHKPFLWTQKQFQDRAANLWRTIAERYRGNRWVAGYNLINEPNDLTGEYIIPVTRMLYEAVREVDPDHLIFVDGNHYGSNFDDFTEAWPNVVYDAHDYAMCGFPGGGPYPGVTRGVMCDKAWLLKHFMKKSAFAHEHGAPIYIGEFGPVYTYDPEIDAQRYRLAEDQIDIYDRHSAHWSIWTYKDIGLQGVVYTAPDSPWMERLRPALERKVQFGADGWGGVDTYIRDIVEPLERWRERQFPDSDPLPEGFGWLRDRLIRHILFAEALLPEFAACFRGVTERDIDELMDSFAFEKCVVRDGLTRALSGEPAPV